MERCVHTYGHKVSITWMVIHKSKKIEKYNLCMLYIWLGWSCWDAYGWLFLYIWREMNTDFVASETYSVWVLSFNKNNTKLKIKN